MSLFKRYEVFCGVLKPGIYFFEFCSQQSVLMCTIYIFYIQNFISFVMFEPGNGFPGLRPLAQPQAVAEPERASSQFGRACQSHIYVLILISLRLLSWDTFDHLFTFLIASSILTQLTQLFFSKLNFVLQEYSYKLELFYSSHAQL